MKSFVIDMYRFRARLLSLLIGLFASCLVVVSASGAPETTLAEAAKFLPDKIESLQASGLPAIPINGISKGSTLTDFAVISDASRSYRDDAGHIFTIEVARTENDSSAYALLTSLALGIGEIKTDTVGTAGVLSASRIVFCKGNSLVQIESSQSGPGDRDQLLALSRGFAETLPGGDDEIPVLVKHLPNWAAVVTHSSYAVTLNGLKNIAPRQPILDALNFEGGAEAVVANYGQSQLVIVEFTTPQISIDNDQRIVAKIQELKNQGQSAPSAYRRVGNYSVFVFNALDEKTANDLIDQVKYQQVVQWLGDDPHLYEKLQRYFANTSAGVLLAVMESSGLSLLVCLGLGALIGGLLFRHRRAQQAASYSDAGGTVRLNLDELTGTNSQRMLGSGTSPGSNSRAS
jgi:hypothetical protein